MAVEIKVPEMGESVSSAFLAAWLVEDGARVEEGAGLCELESDKATLTVPAPASGQVHLDAAVDSEVSVGEVIGSIDTSVSAPESPGTSEEKAAAPEDEHSPAVRRVLAETGVDPSGIAGSGKNGRLLKEDVQNAADAAGNQAAFPEIPSLQREEPSQAGSRQMTRKKMSRIRRTIANNLVSSKQQSAHLTTFNEVDLSRVIAIRGELGEEFLQDEGVKLGFMSFFVKAAAGALLRYPEVNASLDGDEMLYHTYCDVGIAVSTDRGLVVPVLRSAELMSFPDIERAIKDFGERARNRSLGVDEMTGGTFTITNGGIFGSLLSTPIPTPPQTAVLGMHTIQKRPVAQDDQVVIRPMMYLALTYDHRVIDGREAVGFLSRVKRSLENPERMLLES
jgi:2-oxoglutarate dehydrogenase E2 component (dihydrolipoamide succinyltransferase)